MELALTVLQITAPVFLLGAAGFVWCRAGFDYPTAFVTKLAMTLAVPSLIFTTLVRTEIAAETLGRLTLGALLAYLMVALLTWGLLRVLGLNLRTYLAPLTFGNSGNLGLPLALLAFGEVGLGAGIVVFAAMVVIMFTLGLWMVAGAANPARVLREPMLWASLAGALFLWRGWQPPDWTMNALGLLGQMAIPLMLLTLGVAVARLRAARILPAIGLSLAKLVIGIGVAIPIGLVLGFDPVVMGVMILQLATPVGVTSYLLAERYETDAEVVAGLVVVSTLLAVASLPITLLFVL